MRRSNGGTHAEFPRHRRWPHPFRNRSGVRLMRRQRCGTDCDAGAGRQTASASTTHASRQIGGNASHQIGRQPAAKPDTKPHVSFRKKPRPHSQVAEHKRPRHHAPAPDMGAPPAQTAAAPAAQSVSPPAPAPAPIEAAATAAATPPAPPPALPTPRELVVGGHAVQVVSPDEANEIDLAANNASAPANDDPLYNLAAVTPAAASEAATPDTAASAPSADSAKATQPKSGVGSTSWFMQVMAALGGAVAAGSAAWFLIGSASPRINLSEWQEANSEE